MRARHMIKCFLMLQTRIHRQAACLTSYLSRSQATLLSTAPPSPCRIQSIALPSTDDHSGRDAHEVTRRDDDGRPRLTGDRRTYKHTSIQAYKHTSAMHLLARTRGATKPFAGDQMRSAHSLVPSACVSRPSAPCKTISQFTTSVLTPLLARFPTFSPVASVLCASVTAAPMVTALEDPEPPRRCSEIGKGGCPGCDCLRYIPKPRVMRTGA
jgi:hypothetical protein